jgi:hypothetical protein
MIGIETTMNLKKYKLIGDIIPDSIAVLQFKVDAASSDVKILIRNCERYEWLEKTSDSGGVVSIQALAQTGIAADVPTNWFNRWAGSFYLKIFIGNTPLVLESQYEGILFKFYNVSGYENNYLIDLSTGTVTPPDDTIHIFDTSFDLTFS